MRETSNWYRRLAEELRESGKLAEERLSARDFFAVELGLTFLVDYLPGEPAGCCGRCCRGMWPCAQTTRSSRRSCAGCATCWARPPTSTTGAVVWTSTASWASRSAGSGRCLRLAGRRGPATSCALSSGRSRCARAASTGTARRYRTPSPTSRARRLPAAELGGTYWLKDSLGAWHRVTIPKVELPSEPDPIPTTAKRVRTPLTVGFDELKRTAAWMDERLAGKPHIRNQGFARRLADITYQTWDPAADEFVTTRKTLAIDGVRHVIGLMESGKSILADILAVVMARRGQHVTMVLASVAEVLARVSFLQELGLAAVPLLGRSGRARHASTYWQGVFAAADRRFPDQHDPAARYVSTVCLLDGHRESFGGPHLPLHPDDFPCDGLYDDDRKQHGCPLRRICPQYTAERETRDAAIWVTTPAGLVVSRAEPTKASIRWLAGALPAPQ